MSESENYAEAKKVAEKLSNLSDDSLLLELGRRMKDIENLGGYERSKVYFPEIPKSTEELSFGDLKIVGRNWWMKFQDAVLQMICSEDNQDLKTITGGKNIPEIAAGLATAKVIALIAPPSWVIVATTLIAVKIVETGLEALCQQWHATRLVE